MLLTLMHSNESTQIFLYLDLYATNALQARFTGYRIRIGVTSYFAVPECVMDDITTQN